MTTPNESPPSTPRTESPSLGVFLLGVGGYIATTYAVMQGVIATAYNVLGQPERAGEWADQGFTPLLIGYIAFAAAEIRDQKPPN